MSNAVVGKAMQNLIKHRDTKLVATQDRRSDLVLEPNYHIKNCFHKMYSQ